jgi:hypothetical protein
VDIGLAIFAVFASAVTIFTGCVQYVNWLGSTWAKRSRVIVTFLFFFVVVGIIVWAGWSLSKTRLIVKKQDFLTLRETADGANKRGDYDTTIGLVTWTLQFDRNDEALYRTRARAYKHKGPAYYEREIEDRKVVVRLNPARELNQLPIVEDYVLLKRYEAAQAWISKHEGSINNNNVRTMFGFFHVVCLVLQGNDSASAIANFHRDVTDHPPTKSFVTDFWKDRYLLSFLNENPILPSSKATIEEQIKFLNDSAR